ncbi:MAG: hypothetical protein RLZZ393_848 [Pseudomonadota bacterium]|jgi:hypothetical protein
MATYTADAGTLNRLVHVGENVVVSRYISNGVTMSVGDVYQMCRIPNGATITGMEFYGRSSGTGGIIFDVGYTSSALNTLSVFGKATISATDQKVVVGTTTLPSTVSISDDAAQQYWIVTMSVASGTATVTGTFGMIVRYTAAGAGRP